VPVEAAVAGPVEAVAAVPSVEAVALSSVAAVVAAVRSVVRSFQQPSSLVACPLFLATRRVV